MAAVAMYRWPGYVVEDCGYTTCCWIWQRPDVLGYGAHITWRGRCERAHVVWWRMAGGVIPHGMTLDHLCRNRACVNPAHLEVVTRGENCRRGSRAKITQRDADEIRRRRALGEPHASIAATFGLSAGHVCSITKGRGWT